MTAIGFMHRRATLRRVRDRWLDIRWRWRTLTRRVATAWAYLTDQVDEDHARALLRAARETLESWPLESIDARDVLERALNQYADTPGLAELCSAAAARVGSKWSTDGELRSAAVDWAMTIVEEDAAASGVALVDLADAPEEDDPVDA